MNKLRNIIAIIMMTLLFAPNLATAQDQATPVAINCTTVEECQEEIKKLQEENGQYKIYIEEQGLTDDFEQQAASPQSAPAQVATEDLLTAGEYQIQIDNALRILGCTTEAKDEIYWMYYRDGMSEEEIYQFLETKQLPAEENFSADTFWELRLLQIHAEIKENPTGEAWSPSLQESMAAMRPNCQVSETITNYTPEGK